MTKLVRRARFSRDEKYIAVKSFRLSGDNTYIEVGQDIKDIPTWRLRSWYRRGRIGIKGSAWAKQMLERHNIKVVSEINKGPEQVDLFPPLVKKPWEVKEENNSVQ